MDKTKTNNITGTERECDSTSNSQLTIVNDNKIFTDVPALRQEVKAAFIRDRLAKTEQILAKAATEIYSEMQRQVAAYQEPLTETVEDHFRTVARTCGNLHGAIDAAIRLAGMLEAHKGKVDAEVEHGMRQGLDMLLLAVAALPPADQLSMIAKTQLLDQLGPAFDQNVNLRAMLMAAREHDIIRLSRMDSTFEFVRTATVQ
jgi:hypothetical protein